jgi:hypothetical protein
MIGSLDDYHCDDDDTNNANVDANANIMIRPSDANLAGAFHLPKRCVVMSAVWRAILEHDPTARTIDLPPNNFSHADLRFVVEWLRYHDGVVPLPIPEPLTDTRELGNNAHCSPYDAKLVDCMWQRSTPEFCRFIEVAFNLHIPALTALCVAKLSMTLANGE